MGKSKSTRQDGINDINKKQELEKTKNVSQGLYKSGVREAK